MLNIYYFLSLKALSSAIISSPHSTILCHIAYKDIHFKSMIWVNSDCAVSPGIMAYSPAISRPYPEYNSTNLKCSVPGDHNSNHLVFPYSNTTVICHLKNPSMTLLTQKALSPRRPVKMISSPVSPMNSHFKTTFQVELYWLEEISSPEDLINEC